jgi:hypothetical protein
MRLTPDFHLFRHGRDVSSYFAPSYQDRIRHRLRRKFREVLRTEIADTVALPEQVKEEMQYLLSVVSG